MVVTRICDPKTTTLIFPSGKTIVTGAKSEDDSSLVPREYPWYVLLRTQAKGRLADLRVKSWPLRGPRLPLTPTRPCLPGYAEYSRVPTWPRYLPRKVHLPGRVYSIHTPHSTYVVLVVTHSSY
ncbi:hypothetical protein FRC12_024557 [Ceratobasidium sp. 428]|nr:hypothetical protein FRC12_024557 [Ceratobasidium sp. 428]